MRFFTKGLIELFEDQVKRVPQKVAVTHNDKAISYSDLNRRANQITQMLLANGSGSGDVIGVCLKQSIDYIASIIGVLKAGGSYLPLDAELPEERFQYIVSDCSVKIILTDDEREYFKKDNILVKDVSDTEILDKAPDNLTVTRNENDCAYIMYTSGSTGKPKGVKIADRGIIRLVVNTNYVNISEDDIFAQLSTLSFDASTFEIWGALLNGASISIIAKSNYLDPALFDDLLRNHKITTMFLTTSLFNFISSQMPGMFSNIKYLLFGGEKVTPHFVNEIIKYGKPKHLLHVYGPTENTTFSTFYEINHLCDISGTFPIGKAISNSICYVISENGEIADVGTKGELYLGGLGIALGYHNLSELNNQKFIENIYDPDGPAVLYKTGDIVKQLPSGDIEYITRNDELLKIRGFLVELNEIRAIISSYPQIREVFVTYTKNPDEDINIVAFVIGKPGAEFTLPELLHFLKSKLPQYLIPTYIKVLDKLPLTDNGKVDKGTLLKSLDMNSTVEIADFRQNQPLELEFLKIWRTILKQPKLTKKDNFFRFGGHSFLAYKAITKINDKFSLNIKLHNMFEYPTVEDMCSYISSTRNLVELQNFTPNIVTINDKGNKPPIYIIPPFDFLHTLFEFSRQFETTQPVYAFNPDYINNTDANTYSFEDIARIYVEDVIKISKDGPLVLCGWSLGGVIAFEMAKQLIEHNKYNVKLVLLDTEEIEHNINNYHVTNKVLRSILYLILSVDMAVFFFLDNPLGFPKLVYKTISNKLSWTFDRKHKARSVARPIYKNQMGAFLKYRPKPINCDIINLVAKHRYRKPFERKHGCRVFCMGKYEEDYILGNHNDILKEPYVSSIANKIQVIINSMKTT